MSDDNSLRRRIRDGAFTLVTNALRKEGIEPNRAILLKRAHAAVNGAAKSKGVYLTPAEHRAMSSGLATSILLEWDREKARPTPAVTRPARAVKDEEILFALHTGNDKAPSIRTVSKQLGVSKGRVQRILGKHRTDVPNSSALSPAARRVLATIHANTPPDGNRAVDLRRLREATFIDQDEADIIFKEINNSKASTIVLPTTVKSCLGSEWVIICRGRRPPAPILHAWLERAERKRLAKGKNPLRPDQRSYVLELEPAAPGLVFRDLQAVLNVARGTRSLSAWRSYVYASVQNTYEEGVIDREAIVTVCQSMLRLGNVDIFVALSKAANWPTDKLTRRVCGNLFTLTQGLLGQAAHHGDKTVVREWLDETFYRERIVAGLLPGRKIDDLDLIMAAPEDEYWLIPDYGDLGAETLADSSIDDLPSSREGPVSDSCPDHFAMASGGSEDEHDTLDQMSIGLLGPKVEDRGAMTRVDASKDLLPDFLQEPPSLGRSNEHAAASEELEEEENAESDDVGLIHLTEGGHLQPVMED